MYLVNMTSIYISFTVLGPTRGMARPTQQQHMIGAKRVHRYLEGERDLPTIYRRSPLNLKALCDINFSTSREQSKSSAGLICLIGGGVLLFLHPQDCNNNSAEDNEGGTHCHQRGGTRGNVRDQSAWRAGRSDNKVFNPFGQHRSSPFDR